VPQVHADGLALSPDGETLFYQALTARTLYRVPTAALRDPETTADELASQVEAVAESGINDGLVYGEPGAVYLSSLELDAVRRWEPGHGVRTVVRDPRIRWPDSFAWGPNGWLYFTTSQIHRAPDPGVPYKVFRVYPER
jgi:sugar lactone lactonase YvrE